MQSANKISYKILLMAVFIGIIVIGVFSFYIPPRIGSDPSWGFQVMHFMEHRGKFNLLISPDMNDISKNHYEFLTWWSPGQYLLPYFLKSIFGVNDGQAMALTNTCCQLLGFAGFYLFFKKAGFSSGISAASIVFILCQQLFISPYMEYNGGEIILFAFIGWFLYGCLAINYTGVKLTLFVVFSCVVGFICKSSFMWVYIAGLFCVWIRLSRNKEYISWIKNGIWIAVPSVISIAAIYTFFLSRGANPSSSAKGWLTLASAFKLSWIITLFPTSASILANFSIDERLNGLSSHNFITAFSILFVSAILSVCLVIMIIKRVPKKDYHLVIIVFYAICILFFSISYLHRAQISFEGRHVRLIGLITIPGMIYLVKNTKLIFCVLFSFVWACLFALNINDLTRGFITNFQYPQGSTGIPQDLLDKSTIDYISRLDTYNKNNIIVMPVYRFSCTRGLEIQNSRLINFKNGVYKGHAGSIFIFIPTGYSTNKSDEILKSFPGYKNFTMQKLSTEFVLYTAP